VPERAKKPGTAGARQKGRRAGPRERALGVGIVVALAGVAGLILWQQPRFDPALYEAPAPVAAVSQAPAESATAPGDSPLAAFAPAGFEAANGLESFTSDSLYEKINGKAGLYHSAGFEALACQRFRRQTRHADAYEVCVYTMGDADGAFAVYSNQRRAGAQTSDVARQAYSVANALFFVIGAGYVEIVSGDLEGGMSDVLAAYARAMVAASGAGQGDDAAAGPPFPTEGMVSGSLKLHATDAFGFAKLDQIYSAAYGVVIGDQELELRAFLSERDEPVAAAELAKAYAAFLLANGGRQVETKLAIPSAVAIEILDAYEVIFHHEAWFAGVHMSDDLSQALLLTARLYQALGGAP
jgi:hypothetical protein